MINEEPYNQQIFRMPKSKKKKNTFWEQRAMYDEGHV